MKGFIYKITNKVNGKSYIGQTRYTVEFRWRQHQHKRDNVYFHNAIHKYGIENFTVEILEECDYKDLNSREIFYIAKYDTFKNGYNLTLGGDGNRKLFLDDKYDEIVGMYLAGFSSHKIAVIYEVDKATILKILKALNIKIRNNSLNINNQEFQELLLDYQSGYSLKELAKRYNCSSVGLKDYLIRKGVDIKQKYSILNDQQGQINLINDYLSNEMKLSEIQKKYHCSYSIFRQVLSLHGIQQKGQIKRFKLSDSDCLQIIKQFNEGIKVKQIAENFEVDKGTIYAVFKRYHVNYLTI